MTELVEHGPLIPQSEAPIYHSQKGIADPEPTVGEYLANVHRRQTQQLMRLSRIAFDHTHPVDQYQWSSGAPAINPVTIQPTYEMPERIDHITFSLPPGTTSALLQLGDRVIPLYGGTALTTQLTSTLQVGGIVLNRSDLRTLTLNPLAGPFYIGLAGFADEVWGNA